jgi:hypothetical protein
VIIFVALAITVLIGFAGLSTDTGMIWITRSRLQNSVDAAALAAAQELPASDGAAEAAARDVACEYATEHNAVTGMFGETSTCSDQADVTFPEEDGGNAIRVKAYRTVQPIFGQVLGFEETVVWAQATARVGSLGAACLFPFFITQQVLDANDDFYAPVVFRKSNFEKAGNDDGGVLDVSHGASGIRDAMLDPKCTDPDDSNTIGAAVGDVVDTKPGDFAQFKAAWDEIADDAVAPGSTCPDKHVSTYLDGEELDPTLTLASCSRLVVIPVLENGDYSGGNSSGEIVRFIPFYFALRCNSNTCNDPDVGPLAKHDVWGYFVRLDVAGLGYIEYDPNSGTRMVALAD